MDIHYNPKAEKKPVIYSDEIEYYAKQLYSLMQAYRRLIYVKDEDQEKVIQELEYYAAQLISKNYDQVITNSKELISYADKIDGPPWEDDDRYPF